jgi:putative membrane protein
MNMSDVFANLGEHLLAAVVYTGLGIVLFVLAFMIFDRITPGVLWKELLEEHNTALAIVMAGVAIAFAIIIAAAIV